MKIGFYKHISNNLFVKNRITLVYIYCLNPLEGIDIYTGDISNEWNLNKFKYCKNQKKIKGKTMQAPS